MAIKKVEVDRRDCQNYRNYLKRGDISPQAIYQ